MFGLNSTDKNPAAFVIPGAKIDLPPELLTAADRVRTINARIKSMLDKRNAAEESATSLKAAATALSKDIGTLESKLARVRLGVDPDDDEAAKAGTQAAAKRDQFSKTRAKAEQAAADAEQLSRLVNLEKRALLDAIAGLRAELAGLEPQLKAWSNSAMGAINAARRSAEFVAAVNFGAGTLRTRSQASFSKAIRSMRGPDCRTFWRR